MNDIGVIPPPSATTCPSCRASVTAAVCTGCGLVLAGPDANRLWEIDTQLHRLSFERGFVLDRLRRGPAQDPAVPPPPASLPQEVVVAPRMWSPQNLLLVVGAASLAVAAVVFVAVTWYRLGAIVQGAILVALTAGATALSLWLRQRKLTATAEAIGALAVVFALVDVHALRSTVLDFADVVVMWSAGIAVVAAGGAVLSRLGRLRSPGWFAVVGGQLPVPMLAVEFASPRGLAGLLLAQSAATIAAIALSGGQRSPFASGLRAVAIAGAGSAYTIAAVATIGIGLGDEPSLLSAALALTAALVPAAVAVVWSDRAPLRHGAVAVASAVMLAAATSALRLLATGDGLLFAAAVAAVVTAGLALALGRRFGDGMLVVAGAVFGGCAVVPAARVSARFASAIGEIWLDPWGQPLSASLRRATSDVGWPDVAVVIGFAALAVVLSAIVRQRSTRGPRVGVVAGGLVAALALAPLHPDLAVWVPVATAGLVALGGSWLAGARPQLRRHGAVSAGLGWTIALGWGVAVDAATLAVLAVGTVCGVLVAWATLGEKRHVTAIAASVGAAIAGGLLAFLTPLAAGAGDVTAALSLGAAALIGSVLAPVLSRHIPRDRWLVRTVEWAVGLWAAYAILRLIDAASGEVVVWSLAALTAVVASHSLRPDRPLAVWPATALAVITVWSALGVADVAAVEAYSLPLAAALGAFGWSYRTDRSSWLWAGPALVVAAVPTVAVALAEPSLLRPLLAAASGAAALLAGAKFRLKAAAVVGAATVVLLGLRQLAPIVSDLPRWVVFGVIGIVLIGVGATFERRRAEALELLHRYRTLS